MPAPSWHFREMSRGEINVDPVHDEFFKAQELTDALIRESIQNSLDARRGRSTVRVRIRLATGAHALPRADASRYLDGLLDHVDIVAADMQLAVPRDDEPMSFLTVEDSGTRGLLGDPATVPELDEEEGTRNDYYYFFRNVGRSGKGEGDRGRWGLGKAVFPVSSRVRAIFGLTLRPDDDRPLLLGQCVLRNHVANERRVSPYGFWGHMRADDFALPVHDAATIDRFIRDFNLQREEPGLSIVIPFPREADLRFEALIASATRQYFYPITRGDLVVVIEDGARIETIDHRTIESVARGYDVDPKLIALARWSAINQERTTIAAPRASQAPKWPEEPLSKQELEDLRRRFESGERLAFRIELAVKRRRGHAPAASWFDIVLEKDETLRRGDHHFIRCGITIPEVRSAREKTVRALLIADDEPLSTLLGDAENPAHSDWSERADKVKALYDHGPFTVRYVKNSIAQLAAIISTPPEGRVRDFLAEIFSVEIPNGDQPGSAGDEGRAGERTARAGPINAFPDAAAPRLAIAKIAGGFTLRGNGDGHEVGKTFIAESAYRTRTGNPFKRYSEFDFQFGGDSVSWTAEGADIRVMSGNRIAVTPRTVGFQVTISGFDEHRDVVVRVVADQHDAAET